MKIDDAKNAFHGMSESIFWGLVVLGLCIGLGIGIGVGFAGLCVCTGLVLAARYPKP